MFTGEPELKLYANHLSKEIGTFKIQLEWFITSQILLPEIKKGLVKSKGPSVAVSRKVRQVKK